MNQRERAESFFALHQKQGGFLLPCAWDAASARLFEAAGFPAVGTTSAGIAYARGRRDGQQVSRGEMLREVAAIVSAVAIPVTADVEAGYGDRPEDVAHTVRGVLDAGAVGLNLEDRTGRADSLLYPVEDQRRRLAVARSAAEATGLPFVINARTDTYLTGFGLDEAERYGETVRRGRAYLEAGADVVFVPGLVHPPTVRSLVRDLGGQVSLMAVSGAPSVPELLGLGVRRVSTGPSAMLAAMGVVAGIARELREHGTYREVERSFYGFSEAEALFTPPPAGSA